MPAGDASSSSHTSKRRRKGGDLIDMVEKNHGELTNALRVLAEEGAKNREVDIQWRRQQAESFNLSIQATLTLLHNFIMATTGGGFVPSMTTPLSAPSTMSQPVTGVYGPPPLTHQVGLSFVPSTVGGGFLPPVSSQQGVLSLPSASAGGGGGGTVNRQQPGGHSPTPPPSERGGDEYESCNEDGEDLVAEEHYV